MRLLCNHGVHHLSVLELMSTLLDVKRTNAHGRRQAQEMFKVAEGWYAQLMEVLVDKGGAHVWINLPVLPDNKSRSLWVILSQHHQLHSPVLLETRNL